MEEEPQFKTGIAQRNLNPLLAAFLNYSNQVLDVSGFVPMIAITNKPELIAFTNIELLHVLIQAIQNVLRRRLAVLGF